MVYAGLIFSVNTSYELYIISEKGEKTTKNIDGPIRVYKIPIMAKELLSDSLIDLSVPTDKASIAVLPFVNMSGDPEQEYFSDGMTEFMPLSALRDISDRELMQKKPGNF